MNNIKRFVIMIVIYLFLSCFGQSILFSLGIGDDLLRMFIIDLLFMITAIYMYKTEIKKDLKKLKKQKFSVVIKSIIKWLVIIFVFCAIINIVTYIIFPELESTTDGNNAAIEVLFNKSKLYVIFKTLIYAAIAEDLLYKLSLRTIINNKFLFIVTSALLYTILNYIFIDYNAYNYVLVYAIFCRFIPEISFVSAYVKNNDNIIISMVIKIIYNLIPLLILFLV